MFVLLCEVLKVGLSVQTRESSELFLNLLNHVFYLCFMIWFFKKAREVFPVIADEIIDVGKFTHIFSTTNFATASFLAVLLVQV